MLKNIFPIFGVILTNLVGCNLIRSYLLNRDKLIHEYNEILFYTIIFNTLGWAIYGLVIKDIFIFTSCITTIIASFGFIQIMYKYIKPEKLIYIEIISILFYSYFIIIIGLLNFTNIMMDKIIGISCIFTTILMNCIPILIIKQVINTQNTNLIYLPQAIINFINYSCWFIYGYIHYNIILLITNSVSLSLCLFQIIVYCYVKIKNRSELLLV
jgi:hypothetical protein